MVSFIKATVLLEIKKEARNRTQFFGIRLAADEMEEKEFILNSSKLEAYPISLESKRNLTNGSQVHKLSNEIYS